MSAQTPISEKNWAAALDPRVKIGVRTAFGKVPDEIGKWFTKHSTTLAEDRILSYGDMGAMEPFTGQVSFDVMKQEYQKTITHVEYAKGASVQYKLVLTKQLNVIDEIVRAWGRSAQLRYLTSCYEWFNFATSSYTTGDTLSIANSSHTSNDSRGTTQSNLGTDALSFAAFDAAIVAMQKYLTPTSQMDFELKPDALAVGVDMESYAAEIVGSKGKPDVVTNNVNYYYGKLDVIAARPITDTNNWAVINRKRMKESQHWFTVAPIQKLKDRDISTLVSRWVLYCYYGFGSGDWRWMYYGNPS